jgi:hypothetical protein
MISARALVDDDPEQSPPTSCAIRTPRWIRGATLAA